MFKTVPSKVFAKRNRFDRLQKFFILYCIGLFIFILTVPIIEIKTFSEQRDISMYIYILSNNTKHIATVIVFLFLVLIAWNTSYRFRNFVNIMVGFRENDALFNFGILFAVMLSFLSIADSISISKDYLTSDGIGLTNYFYVIAVFLIVGLLWNIVMGLKISKNKRKGQIINISQHEFERQQKETDKVIKGLFE